MSEGSCRLSVRAGKAFVLVLIGLALVRLVLMAVVPVFEPSEARYAAISANMARTGDFVLPHFTYDLEYQSFDGKPPLVFQAGGLFCKLLGTASPCSLQFAVRLFPFLSALLLLILLYDSVRRASDAPTGRLAVMICATATAFYAAAGISMTDMTLTCCVAGALLLYRTFIYTPSWKFAAGVMALMGAGMITKGPVALVMFGLPVFVDACVNRRWNRIFDLRWLWTAPVFFLVAVPWFVLAEQRNPGAVWYFFYNENFLRFVSHDYGDKYGAGREAFRGVSVVWAFVATLPWALVPVWSAVCHRKELKGFLRKFPIRDFTVLAFLAIVGFWCLTSRVLLYYLFPVIPLFAAALALHGDRERMWKLVPVATGLTVLVTVGVLVGGMCFSEKMRGPATPFEWSENHYANEFYHGTKSEPELQKYRDERARHEASARQVQEWLRQNAEEAKRRAAKGAK